MSVRFDLTTVARYVAVACTAIAAILYLAIGFGVVSVGKPASGQAPDLLPFGLMVGGTFAVAAALLAVVRSRVVWVAVAALQIVVIVGYFALASVREPPFESWGLLVKLFQAIVLVAVAYLVLRGTVARSAAPRAS
jgi:hypothetical protein